MKIEKLNKDNIKEFIRDIDTAEEIELNINKLEYYAVKEDDIYLLAFEMLSDEDKISIKYVNNKVKEDKFFMKEFILWGLVEYKKLSKDRFSEGYQFKDIYGSFISKL